jgi:hypothetical protein
MPAAAPPRADVLALYDEGVDAIVGLADRIQAADAWGRTACGRWTAAEIVRHELDVASWYHRWLDRAIAGDATPEFDAAELDAHAGAGVDGLADVEPVDACTRFAADARRYRDRVDPEWDRPFGYPRGTATAGLHAGMAAAEWHLHAWDLAGSIGLDHEPTDAGTLLIAVTACRAVAPGGARLRLERRMAPLAARSRPWHTLLSGSGRQPSPRG